VLFDCARVIALQVKRLTKPFSPAAGLDLSEGALESIASRRSIAAFSAAQPSSIMEPLIKPDHGTQALNRIPRSS
jgi:hypothetical protein